VKSSRFFVLLLAATRSNLDIVQRGRLCGIGKTFNHDLVAADERHVTKNVT
jgi:hypothetical protein